MNIENKVSNCKCANTLVVGRGRLATYFTKHLQLIQENYTQWSRYEKIEELQTAAANAKRIVILIPDKAISPFIDEHQKLFKEKTLIHFSATHRDPRVLGFHPLGTFSNDNSVAFAEISFQGTEAETLFRHALPFLSNKYTQLSEEQMQLYHALCVSAANFSAILWKSFFEEMSNLKISEASAKVYFKMFCNNVLSNPNTALTGPLVRGDTVTLQKNLIALESKPELKNIYQAFVNAYTSRQFPKAPISKSDAPMENFSI